jgi:dTDP-4-amino-4,6-dideoxygalactose transaminase
MDEVPFLELAPAYEELRTEIDAALAAVNHRGWYVLGEEVAAFERRWAAMVGASECVGVGNGLEALHLALRALGVGPGAEVIVPSNTYIATWLAVSMCGATPVPVEPEEQTYNIDPDLIESAITERTAVILPVHLYGQAADLTRILAVAARYGLRVLDDAAQAHGAAHAGAPVGARTDITAWSFYPGKNLGALGDAGAVTTNDSELADRVRVLANYGSRRKYVNEEKGINSRLDEIQAAVLSVKCGRLQEWNARRRLIADFYLRELTDAPLILPQTHDASTHVWHVFVVRHPKRDALADALRARGIGTLIHYPIPPHLQAAYAEMENGEGSFPIAERIHREVLSLPMGPHLGMERARRVVEAVKDSLASI